MHAVGVLLLHKNGPPFFDKQRIHFDTARYIIAFNPKHHNSPKSCYLLLSVRYEDNVQRWWCMVKIELCAADNVEPNMVVHDNRLSFRGPRAMLNVASCFLNLPISTPPLPPPHLSPPLRHPGPHIISFIQPSVTWRRALLSTCWSGEAHLWAYLAPSESSKHSFLWLSVWWRWAAMWNTARHRRRSQQWKYCWLLGCRSQSLPSLSLRIVVLLLNTPHIDLAVMVCVVWRFEVTFSNMSLYVVLMWKNVWLHTLFSFSLLLLKP